MWVEFLAFGNGKGILNSKERPQSRNKGLVQKHLVIEFSCFVSILPADYN
jgi:hypothetical protein